MLEWSTCFLILRYSLEEGLLLPGLKIRAKILFASMDYQT